MSKVSPNMSHGGRDVYELRFRIEALGADIVAGLEMPVPFLLQENGLARHVYCLLFGYL